MTPDEFDVGLARVIRATAKAAAREVLWQISKFLRERGEFELHNDLLDRADTIVQSVEERA